MTDERDGETPQAEKPAGTSAPQKLPKPSGGKRADRSLQSGRKKGGYTTKD